MERKCSWSKYGSVLPFIFHIQFGSYFLFLFFYFFYWFFFNFILNHWFHMIFILYLILILLIFLNPSTNYILFQFYPSSFILIFFMLNLAHIFFNDVYLVLDLYFILNFINWHFFLLGHGFWRFTRIDFSPFTKLLFFQFHPLIFDFCGIVLRAFFFSFLSLGLSKSYAYGHGVGGLTRIGLNVFFISFFNWEFCFVVFLDLSSMRSISAS
jgi:hypothetical protein